MSQLRAMKQGTRLRSVSAAFGLLLALVPLSALAQATPDSQQPIEISSDALEVLQAEHRAIFTGNVIAKQGDTTLRSKTMIVYYSQNDAGAAAQPSGGKGIDRIDAEGDVVVVTPTETAQGDKGIYNVNTDTIDLVGNVVLMRDQNILKGVSLNYNLTTGRSVLNGGGEGVNGVVGSGGRVRGLFVPGGSK